MGLASIHLSVPSWIYPKWLTSGQNLFDCFTATCSIKFKLTHKGAAHYMANAYSVLRYKSQCRYWGTFIYILGHPMGDSRLSVSFLTAQLARIYLVSYRGHLSWSVFHEQAFGMEVACGNGNVYLRTSHTMMTMVMNDECHTCVHPAVLVH